MEEILQQFVSIEIQKVFTYPMWQDFCHPQCQLNIASAYNGIQLIGHWLKMSI